MDERPKQRRVSFGLLFSSSLSRSCSLPYFPLFFTPSFSLFCSFPSFFFSWEVAELLNEYIVNHSSPDDLRAFLDWGSVIASLKSYPETFWRGQLRTWFLQRRQADEIGEEEEKKEREEDEESRRHPKQRATSVPVRHSTSPDGTSHPLHGPTSCEACPGTGLEGRKQRRREEPREEEEEGYEHPFPSSKAPGASGGVVCYPSIALSTKFHEDDALREKTLREKIGKEVLKELSEAVEAYKAEQKKAPPRDVLCSIPVAKIEDVYLPRKAPITNFDDPMRSVSPRAEAEEEEERSSTERDSSSSSASSLSASSQRKFEGEEKSKNEDKRIEQTTLQPSDHPQNGKEDCGVSCETEVHARASAEMRKESSFHPEKEDEEDPCQRGRRATLSEAIDAFSFACQIDHNPSTEFVNIKIISRIPMESLTREERQSLILLSDLLFECDVLLPNDLLALFSLSPSSPPPPSSSSSSSLSSPEERESKKKSPDGYTRISYETLTRLLFEHATSSSSGFGLYSESGAASGSAGVLYHLFTLSITAPIDRYYQAVTLLLYVLCGVQLEPSRVSVHLKRHLKQLTRKKRSGKFLVQQIETDLRYEKNSYPNIGGWGQQIRFLKKMQKDIARATRHVHSAYGRLFSSGKEICLSMVVDIASLPPGWEKPWKDLQRKLSEERRRLLDFCATNLLSTSQQEENEDGEQEGKLAKKDDSLADPEGKTRKKTSNRNKKEAPETAMKSLLEGREGEEVHAEGGSAWREPRRGREKKFEAIHEILRVKSSACDNIFAKPTLKEGPPGEGGLFQKGTKETEGEKREEEEKKKRRKSPIWRLACGIGSSDAGHILVSVQAPAGYGREENPHGTSLLVMAECCSMMEGTQPNDCQTCCLIHIHAASRIISIQTLSVQPEKTDSPCAVGSRVCLSIFLHRPICLSAYLSLSVYRGV